MRRSAAPVLLRPRRWDTSGVARAAFTTRQGGVSEGPFSGLNLAFGGGDREDHVATNRRLWSAAFGSSLETLVEAEQVHGALVAVVSSREAGTVVSGVDALATENPEVWLAVYTADCVPVLVVDPRRPAVAAVHAGWRGIAQGIVLATLRRMGEAFGTDPRRCLVALGPAIGPCCYEVDARVKEAMADAPWWGEVTRRTRPGHWALDLRGVVLRQLGAVGVPPDRVEVIPGCTCCRPDIFFSYRRDRVTGRMAACVRLR